MILDFLGFGGAGKSGLLSLSVILATTFLSLLLVIVGDKALGREGVKCDVILLCIK